MVRYKVIDFDCGFKDSAYISEMPMGTGLSVTKGLTRAKKFYKDEQSKVEDAITKRGYKFEIEGTTEPRPREAVK